MLKMKRNQTTKIGMQDQKLLLIWKIKYIYDSVKFFFLRFIGEREERKRDESVGPIVPRQHLIATCPI